MKYQQALLAPLTLLAASALTWLGQSIHPGFFSEEVKIILGFGAPVLASILLMVNPPVYDKKGKPGQSSGPNNS